ncbi:MAG: spermidine/putrescine ABC transporter substrate-binding protein [Firmicutes bacterium]|nr:spermidine/putrescine ABC transporter substrate-binding protein [Bacillota bacterium]
MKKFLSFIFGAVVFFTASFSAAAAVSADEKKSGGYINVFNWGEYISDGSEGSLDVNKAFEEATGIHVNYTNFTSNEDMYAKLKIGGASYDIIIPSDYMIARLIDEGMVQKIDLTKIPNYKYIADEYKDLYFDPKNEYSVPYNVGLVGLIYNTKMVDEAPTSWSVLWDERYSGKILMFDNPRDTFGIAQFLLGIDINTSDKGEWDKAFEKLKEQKPLVQSYVMDEVFNKMEGGEAALAPYYAGDYLTMKENNPDLAFVYPSEGTNIFVDSICIPASAQNVDGALEYINFLLSPEIALANAEYIYYASPNTSVIENPEYSLNGNEIIYPSEEIKSNSEYFHNLPQETLSYMSDLWDGLKIGGLNSAYLYIALTAVVVIVAVTLVTRSVIRRRKAKYM